MQYKYQVRLEIKSALGFGDVELIIIENDLLVFIIPRDVGFGSVKR